MDTQTDTGNSINYIRGNPTRTTLENLYNLPYAELVRRGIVGTTTSSTTTTMRDGTPIQI